VAATAEQRTCNQSRRSAKRTPALVLESPRRRQTDQNTGPNKRHRLANHIGNDSVTIGAERHPDADLVRPARDRVSRHAVKAEGREHRRQDTEHAERVASSLWKNALSSIQWTLRRVQSDSQL
jgi:hypothetical protein